jgi:ketosteroid isomerase-like protein
MHSVFTFLSGTTRTPETLHVSTGGDMAWATGAVVNEFRGPNGPVEYTGRYVVIWREVEGDWMLGGLPRRSDSCITAYWVIRSGK